MAVTQIHGTSFPGEFLTGNLNFYLVRTLLNITPSSVFNPADSAQHTLDQLVQTISLRAQPTIMGQVTTTSETAPSDLPAAGSNTVTVYNFRFAVEHNLAWEVVGNIPNLAESLNGVAGFVYTIPTTNNNVSVTLQTF